MKKKKDESLWIDIENELTTYSNSLFELKGKPTLSIEIEKNIDIKSKVA